MPFVLCWVLGRIVKKVKMVKKEKTMKKVLMVIGLLITGQMMGPIGKHVWKTTSKKSNNLIEINRSGKDINTNALKSKYSSNKLQKEINNPVELAGTKGYETAYYKVKPKNILGKMGDFFKGRKYLKETQYTPENKLRGVTLSKNASPIVGATDMAKIEKRITLQTRRGLNLGQRIGKKFKRLKPNETKTNTAQKSSSSEVTAIQSSQPKRIGLFNRLFSGIKNKFTKKLSVKAERKDITKNDNTFRGQLKVLKSNAGKIIKNIRFKRANQSTAETKQMNTVEVSSTTGSTNDALPIINKPVPKPRLLKAVKPKSDIVTEAEWI